MSSFIGTCTGCSTELQIPSEYAGQTVNCPQCSAEFVATPPPKKKQQQQAAPNLDVSGAASGASRKAKTSTKRSKPSGATSPDTNPYSVDGGDTKTRGSNLPMKRSYPALKTVQQVYSVLAYVAAGFGALTCLFQIYVLVQGNVGFIQFAITFFMTIAGTAFGFVTMKAMAEGLKLLMDIQDNTLTTARNSG